MSVVSVQLLTMQPLGVYMRNKTISLLSIVFMVIILIMLSGCKTKSSITINNGQESITLTMVSPDGYRFRGDGDNTILISHKDGSVMVAGRVIDNAVYKGYIQDTEDNGLRRWKTGTDLATYYYTTKDALRKSDITILARAAGANSAFMFWNEDEKDTDQCLEIFDGITMKKLQRKKSGRQ